MNGRFQHQTAEWRSRSYAGPGHIFEWVTWLLGDREGIGLVKTGAIYNEGFYCGAAGAAG